MATRPPLPAAKRSDEPRAALILGIIGALGAPLLPFLAWLAGGAAIAVGVGARKRARHAGEAVPGKATAGIVLGALSVVLCVAFLAYAIATR